MWHHCDADSNVHRRKRERMKRKQRAGEWSGCFSRNVSQWFRGAALVSISPTPQDSREHECPPKYGVHGVNGKVDVGHVSDPGISVRTSIHSSSLLLPLPCDFEPP